MLRGLKSYQPSKFESVYFLSKTGLTFLLWLITFEPLEQKQSYIPLLKVLMCGMNAWGAQWHGGIFILQYTSLKMVLLLHKTALVNFPMATTVSKNNLQKSEGFVKYHCIYFISLAVVLHRDFCVIKFSSAAESSGKIFPAPGPLTIDKQ